MDYEIERNGAGRRQEDLSHCDQHGKNCEKLILNELAIEGMKSSMTTIKYTAMALLPIAASLVSYFQYQNSTVLAEISKNISNIQVCLAASATTDAIVKLEIDSLKVRMDRLETKK